MFGHFDRSLRTNRVGHQARRHLKAAVRWAKIAFRHEDIRQLPYVGIAMDGVKIGNQQRLIGYPIAPQLERVRGYTTGSEFRHTGQA